MSSTTTAVDPRPVLRDTRQASAKRPVIRQLFATIAPRYDWFNRLASLGLDQRWRRQAIALGGIAPGQEVLDVCTGTGDLALLCARRLGGRGRVTGIDVTPAMLREAERKARQLGFGVAPSTRPDGLAREVATPDAPAGLRWLEGDAESLPFADASFDRVLIGFSTRNLGDLAAGLREMVRVLRPGGVLVILETGYPANPLLRAAYRVFLLTVARAIGLLLTGRLWPFTYLARSVQQFLTPAEMVARLQMLKTQVQYVPLSFGLASLYVAAKIP
jgi:demethylmenaquinone methyltransferase/2-methoxy-6-polyprenyl-1,4-benzoquinol methylase